MHYTIQHLCFAFFPIVQLQDQKFVSRVKYPSRLSAAHQNYALFNTEANSKACFIDHYIMAFTFTSLSPENPRKRLLYD